MPPNSPPWLLFRGPCVERYWGMAAWDPNFVKPPRAPMPACNHRCVTLVIVSQQPASCE